MEKYFKNNPHKIFLLDGIGACLTAFFLIVILAQLEEYFGMPKNVLYQLASLAGIFAMYSLTCYFFKIKNWRFYLKIIAFANVFYCCLSLFLMIYFYEKLTILGLAYFLGEKIVVLALVWLEWNFLKTK